MKQSASRRWVVVHKPVALRPPGELSLRLEPIPGGTRFTQVSEFDWKKLPRLVHGSFARGVQRDIRAKLRALKRVLEGT